jgi:AraC-like DNA-binding protein
LGIEVDLPESEQILALSLVVGLARLCHRITKMRQAQQPFLVRGLATGYSSGTILDRHSHDWVQLLYASEGVMSVQTDDGTWVVPPNRGVWIPARVGHSITMSGKVAMRTIYFLPRMVKTLPQRCCVLEVSALLRELILRAVAMGPLRSDRPEHRRLVDFMLDQLRLLPTLPLELPMPHDPRALRVAVRMRDSPGERTTLADLAKAAGASRRTLERLFLADTGLTLGRWRQQARLLLAVRMLASGDSVTATALEVGYDSTSAFIEAFSAVFGATPGRYYQTN